MIGLNRLEGFEWDEGNIHKSWKTHEVTNFEAEQIFFNEPLIITDDEKHSTDTEKRYSALGKTDNERNLTVIFTLKENFIRIISARDMSKKERNTYNEEVKKNT